MTTYTSFQKDGALAGLDFRVERPSDWVVVPLPDEKHDFDDPLHFAPVTLLMAPFAAVVFAVAGRPGYADGTVAQWLEWMARQRGLGPGAIEHQQLGTHAGVGCWAMQIEDGTVMRARLALIEDGERMVQVSCMAPDAFWASAAPVFAHMLATFALTAPRGSTVALTRPDAPLMPDSMREATVAPAKAPQGRGPLPLPDAGGVMAGDEPATAASVALAADDSTFEAGHPLNERMRDNGAGLVPNVLDYHEQERWATLAPAALRATLRVPFGWHVIDDGRRTLIFDAAGHTQVSMHLSARDGRTDDTILAAKVPDLQREWPKMRHLRTEVNGMQCLLVRDAEVAGAVIEQAYMLRAAPDGLVLHTRVTSSPSRFRAASDLAEVLLRDLQFGASATA